MSKIKVVEKKLENGATLVLFARDDNGMIVASACDGETRWGEDPNKPEIRCFIGDDLAILYIKSKCRDYLGREDVDFIHADSKPMILKAVSVPRVRMPNGV